MIAPSSKLGPYEISSRIGAGGMGEVWRARDTRIGRDVAVKILPPDFAVNAERLRRFEQEARSAGSLNHPNLVTIHDLGTFEGTPYIVMELLEGETLRDRIGTDSGPRIPIRKAIDMAVQIANGLAAAHDKGIVHRDLKPENIFITRDGRMKILDFGLAKLTSVENATDDSPTQQRDTSPGAVIGTVGYMSPEQVRGQDVDHRTDVFAFGAILYEILTGRRAFKRNSSVETMNAILTEDPPESVSSGQHVSPGVDRIVRRCLEKSREERFQSARDLGFALEAVNGSNTGEAIAAAATPPRARRRLLVASGAAALLIAAVAAVAFLLGIRSVVTPAAPVFTQLTFSAGVEGDPAIAPSGETFVFVRDGDIYLQRTDGRNAINLTKTPDTMEGAPAFSPDGRQISFHSSRDGGIFVMGATGESVRRLSSIGFDPAWSPDGKQIIFTRDERTLDPRSRNSTVSPLMVMDADGGTPKLLLERDAMQPHWSPHGQRIACWANDNAGRRDIYTVAATGNKETVVKVTSDAALDWSPVWSPDGRWLYFSSDRSGTTTLWRVAIDEASGKTRGTPQLISAPAPFAGNLSLSSDGRRLVFQTLNRSNALHRARLDLKTERITIDPTPILDGSLLIRASVSSPDGTMIAFTTEGHEDVFVMRSDGSDIRQLTNDDFRDRGVTWTHDGGRIAFYSSRSGTYQVWTIHPDGSDLTQVTKLPNSVLPNFPAYSPDDKKLAAVSTREASYIGDATRLPITTVDVLPPIPSVTASLFPMSWSPDGKRLAGRPWTGRPGIYVYSIAERTHRLVAQGWSNTMWLDDERLLLNENGTFAIADWRTGATREILKGDLSMLTAVAVSPEYLVLSSARVEGDIWMATLDAK